MHKKWHLGKRKIFDFIAVAKILKRIIKEENYTHFVIVNSIWAILLIDVLMKNKGKYILDIRDYKCEKLPGINIILKKIIDNSFFTTISSGGFREFLPKSEKIIENHNISNTEYKESEPRLYKGKEKINIVYMGYVRYYEENKKIIDIIKKSIKYYLTYMGTYAVGCSLKDFQSKNIVIKDFFNNADKPNLYKNYDMIHSIYGNKDISVKTLTPNRLYDAAQYKKPILVSKGTYLEKVVNKYKLGIALDLDDKDFIKKLDEYTNNFDSNNFVKGAELFLNFVHNSQRNYFIKIKEFIR